MARVNNGRIPGYDPKRDSAGYHFDKPLADEACDFFHECLTHVKGELAGQPFDLEPWERAVVRAIFGWLDEWGFRRYRHGLIFVPRKNGKTMLGAGIGCRIFFCDDEPGAEGYSAAGEREQAKMTWNMAKEMIQADEDLNSRCRILTNSITIEDQGKSWKPISKDASTKHGFNSHFILLDELHVQPNRELYDALKTSTGARRQPLILYLTTSDFDRPSICNEVLDYAQKVRDGVILDPTFLPVIYETHPEANWRLESTWKKANPNYGISIKKEYIRAQFKEAVEKVSYENTFRRLHLNQKTAAEMRWLDILEWNKCEAAEEEPGEKSKCYSGLDLSHTTDITAWVLFFPDLKNRVDCIFWVPEEHKEAKRLYEPWIKQGYIRTTPGNVIDYQFIRHEINRVSELYAMEPIAVDPWNARPLAIQLREEDGIEVVLFRQGYQSLSEPSKELDRLIKMGKLGHNGNPVLRWMATNVMITEDAAGNIKPNKEKSPLMIDGIAALVMAMGTHLIKVPEKQSVYMSRGFRSL